MNHELIENRLRAVLQDCQNEKARILHNCKMEIQQIIERFENGEAKAELDDEIEKLKTENLKLTKRIAKAYEALGLNKDIYTITSDCIKLEHIPLEDNCDCSRVAVKFEDEFIRLRDEFLKEVNP